MSSEQRTANLEAAQLASAATAFPVPQVAPVAQRSLPQKPSALYGALLWKVGLSIARVSSRDAAQKWVATLCAAYASTFTSRRETVIQNLLPALNGDRELAEAATSKLFQNFARKLVDLWRFEAGLPLDNAFTELTGWEHFLAAQKTGRGVLLVTPHLGNWEFGAPLLTQHGFKLNVITLVEPGRGLTEMRQAARARWGIDTLVIGRDPFAFVEIIRRLENGATVALLIDRPPKTSAVDVQLFGRPFAASLAAAELARATGCELLPVDLVANGDHYAARISPAISYDRASLRDRAARQQLTQRVVTALEPAIRAHIDQWYHFVPVWSE
ncbi:MAG TPA: lysophospholipid acyltransferase family protein [Candidatus Acidoferrum sp.]|nr:lysophospholipid acyltransferase family protein [Candidatus Acidoferrum sp.]